MPRSTLLLHIYTMVNVRRRSQNALLQAQLQIVRIRTAFATLISKARSAFRQPMGVLKNMTLMPMTFVRQAMILTLQRPTGAMQRSTLAISFNHLSLVLLVQRKTILNAKVLRIKVSLIQVIVSFSFTFPFYQSIIRTDNRADSRSFLPQLSSVVQSGIQVVVWAGDADWMCNWFGNFAASNAITYSGSAAFNAASLINYTVGGVAAGTFKTVKNLSFLRVFAAVGKTLSLFFPFRTLYLRHLS